MDNVIVFFCDISRTINGKTKNTEDDYILFNENLNMLLQLFSANNVIFSLISSDNDYIVNAQINILSKYFNKNIILGRQFFVNGYFHNNENFIVNSPQGKWNQIIAYINELSKNFKINKIFYADDTELFHQILHEINIGYDKMIISLIPREYVGLKELNILISNILEDKKELKYIY